MRRIVVATLAVSLALPGVVLAKNDNDRGNSSNARSTTTTVAASSGAATTTDAASSGTTTTSVARGNSGNAGNSSNAGGNSSNAGGNSSNAGGNSSNANTTTTVAPASGTTATTIAPGNSGNAGGNSGNSGTAGNSGNAGGNSGNAGGNSAATPGSSGKGAETSAEKKDAAAAKKDAATARAEAAKSGAKSKKDDDADEDESDDSETDEQDPDEPDSYIVRFVAGTNPAEFGKKIIDDFNKDVDEENAETRKAAKAKASAAAAAAKAKGKSSSAAAAAAAKVAVKLKARGTFKKAFSKVLNAAVIEIPPAAVAGISRNPRVLSVERDAEVLVDPTPVSQTGATWGIDRIDQRALPLSGTFSAPTTASNVAAYVVDTGIDASHPEFGGRVINGFDAVSGGSGATDCNGHGTHVAGTIASATYGVAKSAILVPVRVLGCDGSGTYSGVIAGLDWIAHNRPSTQRAVVNMSLGGGTSSSLDSAVASLVASGVAVVVAAGNSNVDACTSSPARAASAITVGSTTTTDSRSSFSNFGSCLDIFAPGSNITSTVPGGGTAVYSGTSMASPHVAGVAAVVLSQIAMTPSQLATYLTDNATTGVVGSAGTGSPNLLAFLPGTTTPTDPGTGNPTDPGTGTPATAPAQPSAPIAEARNKAAIVSWSLPDDGGSAITAQTIRTYSGGRVVATTRVDGVTTSTRISRLRNGVDYSFTVQATNAVGSSAESTQSNVVRPAR